MNGTTFLLVHGSWHGPWCWERLRAALDRRGCGSAVVALPSCGTDLATLGGLKEDADAVATAAGSIEGDIIVVGHSYGGAVITEASFGKAVRRLVFLGAFMPDVGRPYVSYFPPGPLPPYLNLRDDGTMEVVNSEAAAAFYGDCTSDTAAWAISRLVPQAQAVVGYATTRASWRTIPSTYVILTKDHAIPPDMQRDFARQATDTREMDTSHSPMLSQPEALAALLLETAAGNTTDRESAS